MHVISVRDKGLGLGLVLGLALGLGMSLVLSFNSFFFSQYYPEFRPCNSTVMHKQPGTPKVHVSQTTIYRAYQH